MNPSFKLDELIKQIQEIRDHLGKSQGLDLKSRLDATKTPIAEKVDVLGDKNPLSPKGVAIEKVSVLGKEDNFDDKVKDAIASQDLEDEDVNKGPKMPGEDDMSEEEIEELERMLKQKVRV